MKHIQDQTLMDYINDQLTEPERMEVERHLDECELCFESYLTHIDSWSLNTSLSEDFTDQTINQLIEGHKKPEKIQKQNTYSKRNKTFFNYAIAAGLTVLLMFSGVFESMFTSFNDDSIKQRPSISKQLVEKTGNIIEIDKNKKGE